MSQFILFLQMKSSMNSRLLKMNLENGQQIDNYIQNEQDTSFKCEVCALTFRISSERNIHILSHFQQKNCSICSETLIRLGNIWYSIHEHPNHNDNENNANPNSNHNECRSEPVFVETLKCEPDLIYNEQTETQFEECFMAIDGGSSVKTENDTTNYQTEFVRVSGLVEQQPLNIVDNPDSNTQETLEDTPMLDDSDSNTTENDETKIKTKGQCHICLKKVAGSTNLKYHMNLHMGIKPFVCEICEKSFADKRNLLRHLRMHKQSSKTVEPKSDIEALQIPVSNEQNSIDVAGVNAEGQDIPMHDDFQKSEQVNAMPKIQTKGQCHICMKKIVCATALQYHLNIHFGLKPFVCQVCDTAFADKRALHRHEKIHPDMNVKIRTIEYNIKDFYDDDNLAERESENTDWICEYCNTDFKLENYLAKHILKEHDDKKSEHNCSICVEKLSSLSDLLVHMRAHPESTQYKCTFDGCEHGFAYKARLSAHLAKHRLINGLIIRKTQDDVRAAMMQHAAYRLSGFGSKNNGAPDEDLICNICSKKYPNQTALQQHIQAEHKNERIKCLAEGCDKIFKGKTQAFTKHIQVHHPELIRECNTCKKVFYSDAKLAEHQRRHNSFACNLCTETFALKHYLVIHMSKHEKEAKCDICNLKFHSVKRMMTHRECHIDKKMIKCRYPGCNQSFEKRSEFTRHTIQQHPDNNRYKTVCSYCGKAITNSFFKDHLNIHTGERPHECLICKKTFSGAGSLTRHKMIHTGEKPYVCDVDGCSQAYRDSIDLKRHKFSVHKIYTKKHICSICSKVFPERKLLRNHIIKVHDKVDHESVLRTSQTI